jgi:hypothetical protein
LSLFLKKLWLWIASVTYWEELHSSFQSLQVILSHQSPLEKEKNTRIPPEMFNANIYTDSFSEL